MSPLPYAVAVFAALGLAAGCGERSVLEPGIPAGECVDYANFPHWVAGIELPGEAWDVVVAEDLAFVASFSAGVQIVDLSEPHVPQILSEVPIHGLATGVCVDGDWAFVADGSHNGGVLIVDISDPTAPRSVSSPAAPGASAVKIRKDLVYVGREDGFQIIDVQDHGRPRTLAQVPTEGFVRDVAIDGSYAYLAEVRRGLLVVDVSDPTMPEIVGDLAIDGPATGVAVAGNLAYVAASNDGLLIVNVSDPSQPSILGSVRTVMGARAVELRGEHAFVPVQTAGVQIINISDPASPKIVATVKTPGSSTDVATTATHVFVADLDRALQVIDTPTLVSPPVLWHLETPRAAMLEVAGSYAFISSQDGIRLLNVSDSPPSALGAVDLPGAAQGIFVQDDLAYIVGHRIGLRIVDFSDPSAPFVIGATDSLFSAVSVTVRNDRAYAAAYLDGVHSLDVTDPRAPRMIGTMDTPDRALGARIADDHLLIADNNGGLVVASLDRPDHPRPIAALTTVGDVRDVTSRGTLAFLSESWFYGQTFGAVSIIDISAPREPSLVGRVVLPDYAFDLVLSGRFAYVANNKAGVQVVDVSNVRRPAIVGTVGLQPGVWHVATSTGSLYADSFESLVEFAHQCR